MLQTLRRLRQHRLSLGAMALSLALGVGLNGGVLAVLWSSFGGSLPYRDDRQLVTVAAGAGTNVRAFLTELEATELRGLRDLLPEVTTVEHWPASRRAWVDVEVAGRAMRASGALVMPNVFDVLGVTIEGRAISDADVAAEAPVAIVTDQFARRHLDGSALGKQIRVNGTMVTVIGQLPRNFVAPTAVLPPPNDTAHVIDIWIPQSSRQVSGGRGGGLQYTVIARISHGDVETLSREITSRLSTRLPRPAAGGYSVVRLRASMLGTTPTSVAVMVVLGALLLGVALVNVMIVSLLRVDELNGEIAIRLALGASGLQLWALPVCEAGLLIVVGALSGAITSGFVASVMIAAVPGMRWMASQTGVVWSAGVIAALVSIAAAGLCVTGMMISQRRHARPASTLLVQSGRLSRRTSTLQSYLMVGQLTLAIVLAAPTVALWQSLVHAGNVNRHLGRSDVLVAQAWLIDRESDDVTALKESLRNRISAVPGVREVSFASDPPLLGAQAPMLLVGVPSRPSGRVSAYGDAVEPSYLTLVGLGIVRGSSFSGLSSPAGSLQALISVSFAKLHFGETDPIGQVVDYRGKREIVGVVGDEIGRDGAPRSSVYVPLHDVPYLKVTALVRVENGAIASQVSRALGSLPGPQPIDRVQPLDTLTQSAFRTQRLFTAAASAFAVCAVVLAFLGVVVMTSYRAQLRRQEIATRAALGALPKAIALEFVFKELRHALIAVGIAVPTGMAALRVVVEAVSPLPVQTVPVLAAVSLVVLAVGGLATFITYWFAAREPHLRWQPRTRVKQEVVTPRASWSGRVL